MSRRGRISRKTYVIYNQHYYMGRNNGDGTVDLFSDTESDSALALEENWKYQSMKGRRVATVDANECAIGTF